MIKTLASLALCAMLLSSLGCTSAAIRRNGRWTQAAPVPDLHRIMEAWVPVTAATYGPEYLSVLRKDVVLPLRDLQAKGIIRWYGFLLHPCPETLSSRTPLNACFQLWVERAPGIEFDEFRKLAPTAFLNVDGSGPSLIAGLDKSMLKDGDWAYAWKMIGESSSWISELLLSHNDNDISLKQTMQFLHYVTNPLLIGGDLHAVTIGATP